MYKVLKNSFLVIVGLALSASINSCGRQEEPAYRAYGATPQECYAVMLKPDTVGNTPFRSYKGQKVCGFTLASKSRPFIAHDLLAGTVSPLRIACGDTVYRFRNADETYAFSVEYDRKCVPDYGVLLRDFVAHSGIVSDTSTAVASMLKIVDIATYRAAVAPFLRSTGVNIRFDSAGHWMYYTPMPEGDTRQPMHLFEIVSALRYYWDINVVPDPSLDLLELFTTGEDFATSGLGQEQVCEMLKSKFGMELVDAGRDVTVVNVCVEPEQ